MYDLLRIRTALGLTTVFVSADTSKAFDTLPVGGPYGLLQRLRGRGASVHHSVLDSCADMPGNASQSFRMSILRVYELHRGVAEGSSVSPAAYVRFCHAVSTAIAGLRDDHGMRLLESHWADTHLDWGPSQTMTSLQLILNRYASICP